MSDSEDKPTETTTETQDQPVATTSTESDNTADTTSAESTASDTGTVGHDDEQDDDDDIESMLNEAEEMADELKVSGTQSAQLLALRTGTSKEEFDARSVCVKNLDTAVTATELVEIFPYRPYPVDQIQLPRKM